MNGEIEEAKHLGIRRGKGRKEGEKKEKREREREGSKKHLGEEMLFGRERMNK